MTRCDVSLCNDPISKTGFVCCVCEHAFCKLHGGPGGKEMGCCENCTRECMFCGKITNAGDGIHVRDDFKCAECIDGLTPRISVELGPLDVCDILPPLVPVFEEPNEICA